MNLRERLSEAFSQQRDLTRSYRDAEERIVAVARDRLHLATTTDEAYEIWRDYSNSLLAEWLVVQSDDEIVREILEFIDRYAMRSRRFQFRAFGMRLVPDDNPPELTEEDQWHT